MECRLRQAYGDGNCSSISETAKSCLGVKLPHDVFKNPNTLSWGAGVLAVGFWIADALVDWIFFEEQRSFLQNLLEPEPMEFWMRCLVVGLLLLFSVYAKHLLLNQIRASDELNRYKDQLEQLVEERSGQLHARNAELENEILERRKAEQALEKLAITDPLTSLFNRRKFDEILHYEIERDRRYRGGLMLMMCDLDNFKKVNDQYGHDAGDQVLITFARTVKESIRSSDIFARWGGEEFVLLMPASNVEVSMTIANKIRRIVEMTPFSPVASVTVSIGVTLFRGDDDADSLLHRADAALYKAKEEGRNRVEFAH